MFETFVRDVDAIIEYRLVGFFAFLEHAATACLRGRDGHHFEKAKLIVRGLLTSATPDWSDEVCSLEELWDVEVKI